MQLIDLAVGLNEERERILIEDGAGRRWRVVRVFAVGANTDDPGLVIKIEPEN